MPDSPPPEPLSPESSLPASLIDCRESEDNELFVVEGISAANAIKPVRDHRCQAVLPMQGKIPNASRTPDERLFAHPQVADLFNSIRSCSATDPLTRTSPVEFRYRRVMLLNDPDADGHHAGLLLILLLYTHLPELIAQERVSMIRCPLYGFYANDVCVALAYSEKHALTVADGLTEDYALPPLRRRFKGVASLDEGLRRSLLSRDCGARLRLSMSDCEALCRPLR